MKAILSALLVVLICAGLPAQSPPEARTALVFGVGNYSDRYFTKLEAPETDAKAMADKLRSLGFNVTLKLNATRREMLDATDAFGTALAERKGVGLFYFSGHGSMKPDEADPNFLIPAGSAISSREDLPQEAFNAQRVANRMKDAGNRLNLIFLDACRNNPLPSRSKDAAGGLAAMRGASGLMYFFATQPNQIAMEDSEARSSLFTAALLKHMATPGLSFMDMMADVTAETEQLSTGDGSDFKQSPYMSGTLSGRFAFLPQNTAANAPPPATLPSEPKAGTTMQVALPGGENLTLCYCPAGSFTMGSPLSEQERRIDEDQVQVRLTKGYWMARTECTQGQWEAVMGNNPSDFKGSKALPVERVSWEDAQAFIMKLNASVSPPPGMKWSLPSEAQWEYACRAGTESVFAYGETLTSAQANFNGDYPYGSTEKGTYLEKTSKVGSYAANAWGMHDMHGSVHEWCADWYAEKLVGGTDPVGAPTGSNRVSRGGSWFVTGYFCRSADRGRIVHSGIIRRDCLGFRIAAVPAGP